TGPVGFYDGSTLIANVLLSSGVAVLNHAFTTGGTHSLTATYDGSTTMTSSTSTAVSQTVNQAGSSTLAR
ncbi:MAG: Ig-like domain repeat protein, partial [Terriglobales bacterium]